MKKQPELTEREAEAAVRKLLAALSNRTSRIAELEAREAARASPWSPIGGKWIVEEHRNDMRRNRVVTRGAWSSWDDRYVFESYDSGAECLANRLNEMEQRIAASDLEAYRAQQALQLAQDLADLRREAEDEGWF